MNNMDSNVAFRVVAESYKLLGLPLCATEQEIKSAYKRLALKYHPDRPGGSNEKFVALQNAYEILTGQVRASDLQMDTSTVADQQAEVSQYNNKDAVRVGTLDVQTYIKEKSNESGRLDMNYFSQLKFDYSTALDEERDFYISFPITFGPYKFDPLDFVGNMNGAKARYHKVTNNLEEAKYVAERENATIGGDALSGLHHELQSKGAEPYYVIYKIRCTPRVLIDNFSSQNVNAFLTNVVSAYHLNYKPLSDEKYDRIAKIDMESYGNRRNAHQQINNVLSDVKSFKPDYNKLKEVSFDTRLAIQNNSVEKLGLSENAKLLFNNAVQRVLGKNITSIFPTSSTPPMTKPPTKNKGGLLNKLAKSVLGSGGITNPSMPDYVDIPELPMKTEQNNRTESRGGYQTSFEIANVKNAENIKSSIAFVLKRAQHRPDMQSHFDKGIESLKEGKSNEAKAYIDRMAKEMITGRHQFANENQKPENKKHQP